MTDEMPAGFRQMVDGYHHLEARWRNDTWMWKMVALAFLGAGMNVMVALWSNFQGPDWARWVVTALYAGAVYYALRILYHSLVYCRRHRRECEAHRIQIESYLAGDTAPLTEAFVSESATNSKDGPRSVSADGCLAPPQTGGPVAGRHSP